jgi:hypothetical protein
MLKNGTTAMTITSVTGTGTTTLEFNTNQTLTATDWAMINYTGSTTTNGIRDVLNNVLTDDVDPDYGGTAFGHSGNTVIDLSGPGYAGQYYDIEGMAGNDTLTGADMDDYIDGGQGADTLTGGLGFDEFNFTQGNSPAVTFQENGGAGVTTGDTFTFAGLAADRVTDFSSGDALDFGTTYDEIFYGGPVFMGSTPPSDGMADDQGFFAVQGNYNSGVFTVNTTVGVDTLMVSDGDSSSGITQTGLVLSGVTLSQLGLYTGNSWVEHM